MKPTDQSSRRIAALDQALATTPDLVGRLRRAVDQLDGRIAFSTSLGLEDQAILHAIAQLGERIDVFTLDTGRLFPETLDTIAESELRYGTRIRVVTPEAEHVETLVARDGVLGFRQSIRARKACCEVRKVRPLRVALSGAGGWITGLRREQSAGRAEVAFAEYDQHFGITKINPLADWSLGALQAYIAAHDIPVNALHTRGFPSIGCQSCTRAIRPGEDIRAGRWWWEQEREASDEKECGLHSPSTRSKEVAQ